MLELVDIVAGEISNLRQRHAVKEPQADFKNESHRQDRPDNERGVGESVSRQFRQEFPAAPR